MTIAGIADQPPLVEVTLATALFGVLLADRAAVKGTTLTAPLNWATLSAALLLLVTFLVGDNSLVESNLHRAAIWYAVSCSTLCPLIGVLGAKRPQNLGWQWVVFTLWLILIWPAFQALALPAGPRLELFAAWKIFLVVLIGLGLLNYLPTRHWLAAILVATGQGFLLSENLGFESSSPWRLSIAMGCFLLAALVVLFRQIAVPEEKSLDQFSQRWLRFRNAFGAFWGIRILQRVNETAKLRHWPVELTWPGFEPKAEHDPRQPTKGELDEIEQTLDTLLRRFF
ncbi:hypothetical protein [Bythopirellula polymerisocia]|uniref:Uncharacterized protein n=1 Tax=Bythopirellula polymerisocia TaxID=2528003 RepID=A0A5C6CJX3_9BACT|nr:hypothetical protein [Bythopirellula polymerisocia]TWU23591.1 hypothetical protein Pla144_37660 [Bythopirellula polymerisocia]